MIDNNIMIIRNLKDKETVKEKIDNLYKKVINHINDDKNFDNMIPKTTIYEKEHIVLKNEIETFIIAYLLTNDKLI